MKINVNVLISRYLEQPRLKLIINRTNGAIAALTWKEYDRAFFGKNRFEDSQYGKRRDLALYFGPNKDRFLDIRQRFLKKKRLFSKVNPALLRSTPRFNGFIKDRDLWDEYVGFYIECETADLSEFVLGHELTEEEASVEEYLSIGALLKEYESYRFWKAYSDGIYFSSYDEELSGSGFVVLGHNNETFGIAFYVGYFGYHDYAGIADCEEPVGPLGHTIGTLGTTISLYCDPKGEEIIDEENPSPYGEERLSSIVMCKGRSMKNRLGTTTAKAVIRRLRYAIDLLKTFRNTSFKSRDSFEHLALEFKRSKNDFLYRLSPYYDIAEPHFLHGPYYPWNKVSFVAGAKTKSAYSFCFRLMPAGLFPGEENPAWMDFAYIALLCDDASGMILVPAMLQDKDAPFIQRLTELADERFSNIPTPKTIYVNSEFDAHIAEFLFAPYLKQGSKIQLTDESLPTDEAYESLCGFLSNEKEVPKA